MNADDELCLCFHISRRKVEQFIRAEHPTRPSQLSQCYGAGTGCGWCRPFLERLLEEADPVLPDADDYQQDRQGYREKTRE